MSAILRGFRLALLGPLVLVPALRRRQPHRPEPAARREAG